jgi:carbon monoxide dehydrogenase subunit G
VRLVDADAPRRGRLEGEVAGPLGTLTGGATFRLAESGSGTTIDYEGQAVIGGPLARLDSRFVEGLAGSLIGQGLRTLDSRLRADVTTAGAGAGGRPAGESPA